MLRVPQSCSHLHTRERHKKPPAEAGGHGSREPAASCRSSLGGPLPAGFNPAFRAWRSHKKPPAEAGGLRVACLPGCHAKRVRTGKLCAVIRHGRRGGFHARSPRVSTRGFLDGGRDRFPIQWICKTTFASGFLQRRRPAAPLRAPSKGVSRGHMSGFECRDAYSLIFRFGLPGNQARRSETATQ